MPRLKLMSLMLVAMVSATAHGSEFFEKKIRPVLVQHCYECHNSLGKKKGDLALDYKAALRAGGESGKVIAPGKPEKSILIWSLRHENDYKMPSKSPKLDDAVIRDFETWVKMGAPDPRLHKPTKEELARKLPWEKVRQLRSTWWSFQPLDRHAAPKVSDAAWSANPIDQFIFDRMKREGLTPQPEAPREVLVRRLHLILTGLPPTPEVVKAFVDDKSPEAYNQLVDRLLASKAFGERWARHWMDWYRYAESHGSEGDPRIPYVQQYRDYLIRALNDDVPYDQLLREHLAGDLMASPRVNKELGINESAVGPAHLRMVPHGFGVTDAYGEQITFTDNQIDVIGKAMMGVTVSCARCHDHKFDPISQKDFYRFYGMMVSCRASNVLIDTKEKLEKNKTAIAELKQQIRRAFAKQWLAEVNDLPNRLNAKAKQIQELRDARHPLGVWVSLKDAKSNDYQRRIGEYVNAMKKIKDANAKAIAGAAFYVDLRDPANANKWFVSGNSTANRVSPAGSFALQVKGGNAIAAIYPRGIYTHLISDKHGAVFSSANYAIAGKGTHVRVAGSAAQLRAPVRNYPLKHGGLHPADGVKNTRLEWRPTQKKWDYWRGEKVHYELSTSKDTLPNPGKNDRSWFGVTEIFAGERPPQNEGASLVAVCDDPASIKDRDSLLKAYTRTLQAIVRGWSTDKMTDAEAEFLDAFVQTGVLTNQINQLPAPLQKMIARYRELENEIPVPTRAPGVLEAEPVDQPLLVRGLYKNESDPVERQFLEIFSTKPYSKRQSGRLELANDMVGPANTLKTRVLINRLWAYVFGHGIVSSTDNFGRLGKKPTHPELLDYLSLDFENNGWSIKRALRQMVTSRTFRLASQTNATTREKDGQNLYLSHFTPRRLDAEAIHDSISLVGGNTNRAVYLPVIRNRLDPFLAAFNAPVPTSTVSFRTSTNVPAQSLTMMNGALVERSARAWASKIERDSAYPTPQDKIAAMFMRVYARQPSARETQLLMSYLTGKAVVDTRAIEVATKHKDAQGKLTAMKQARAKLVDPVREKLQRELDRKNRNPGAPKPVDLKPIGRWDFDGDTRDSVGGMHGVIKGKAKVESGTLVLNGGCVFTRPIAKTLRAKTIEVLVQLSRLDQRGGGAITVQTMDGHTFDSVVFGEMHAGQWLAGSNSFRRTNSLDGQVESEAVNRPVRIALVYEANGMIRCYRDGKPYGKAYRKSGLNSYSGGKAQVVFGLRHGTKPGRGRDLYGRIHEARLYDRALSAKEVAATVTGTLRETVTQEKLLAALSSSQKRQLKTHDEQIEQLQQSADKLAQQMNKLNQNTTVQGGGYYGIAHALLNSKEFIYVH